MERLIERFATLFPGMLYIVDLHSARPTYIDAVLASYFGQTPETCTLSRMTNLLDPADVARLRAHHEDLRHLRHGETAEFVVSIPKATGERRWLKLKSRALSRGARHRARRIIGMATDISADHQRLAALEATSRDYSQAEQIERRRIGREIHDSTMQHLVAIDLLLGSIERNGESKSPQTFQEVRNTLSIVQAEVRTFAYTLHPPELSERGLEQSLIDFCRGFAHRTGLRIDLTPLLHGVPLTSHTELALFRIAQEGLMNVHRHACADRVAVRLLSDPRWIILEIEDDGRGMGHAQGPRPRRGVGLAGMEERMHALGGDLTIASSAIGLRLTARPPRGTM